MGKTQGPWIPDIMPRPLLVAANLSLAGMLVWLLWYWEPMAEQRHPIQALTLGETPTGGDFRLESAAGPLDLANLRGQVVLIHFGYTWCPDVCPTNLAFIANAIKTLSLEEQERVEVLFVSVDPERDDTARLAQYTAYFHPRFRGLTGSPEQIAEVARRYGAAYRRGEQTGSRLGYVVDHTSSTYVVDPQGRLVMTLGHATQPDQIAAAIRALLVGG